MGADPREETSTRVTFRVINSFRLCPLAEGLQGSGSGIEALLLLWECMRSRPPVGASFDPKP